MKESTVIYRSFYESIKELPKENQAELWNAIFEYSLNFKLIELQGISKTVFTLIKPQIDANNRKYENGKKAKQKQKVSKTEANDKQTISKTYPNVNDNVNDNNNENNNDNINDIFAKIENSIWDKLKDHEKIERVNLIKDEFKNSSEYQNNLCRNYSLSNYELNGILIKFLAMLDVNDRFNDTFTELKKYFNNWINKNLDTLKPKNVLAR